MEPRFGVIFGTIVRAYLLELATAVGLADLVAELVIQCQGVHRAGSTSLYVRNHGNRLSSLAANHPMRSWLVGTRWV